MKTNPYKTFRTALFAGLLAGSFTFACSADVIYQDNFDRAAGALNGSAPTIDNSGLAATWTASAGYNLTGTNLLVDNSVSGDWQSAAKLPLDFFGTFPDPRAQVDVQVAGSWVCLEFGDGAYWGWPGMPAVLKLYGNGNVDVCQGPGWDGGFVKASFPGAGVAAGWNRLRIEYSNTLETANFYVNGALLYTMAVPTNAPMSGSPWATGVGLISDSTFTLVTNFVVTYGSEGACVPPSITAQPTGQAVFTNDPVSLSVEADGSLPLNYQWRKNGTAISGATGRIYTIPAAAMSDTGSYDVVVGNACSSGVASAVAQVQVHYEQDTIIAQVNWDDLWTNHNWDSAWGWASDMTGVPQPVGAVAAGAGVGGSNGFKVVADGTAFVDLSETYAGFAAATDLATTKLTAGDPYYYIFSYSARVEGLYDGTNDLAGRVNLHFSAPGVGYVLNVQKAAPTWTSNFQAFTFVLSSADFGGPAGAATFAANVGQVNAVQVEFNNDSWYTRFPWGPGATVVVDDVKLILRQSPPLSVSWTGTQAVLSWVDPNVELQGAADLAGPYTAISGATSPYTVPEASPYRFFRTAFPLTP